MRQVGSNQRLKRVFVVSPLITIKEKDLSDISTCKLLFKLDGKYEMATNKEHSLT
jgi:hypothetical protein